MGAGESPRRPRRGPRPDSSVACFPGQYFVDLCKGRLKERVGCRRIHHRDYCESSQSLADPPSISVDLFVHWQPRSRGHSSSHYYVQSARAEAELSDDGLEIQC